MSDSSTNYDAIVIGSGPNGLSAAILMAQQGLKVHIIEAEETIGGGTRTKELTEPGFLHDVCSAVHPTAVASPFLSTLPLKDFGLEWVYPEVAAAHPLENGEAVLGYQSLDKTLEGLGSDATSYSKLFKEFINAWESLKFDLFGTLRNPKNPLLMARFGLLGMQSTTGLANSSFKTKEAKAFLLVMLLTVFFLLNRRSLLLLV